MAVTDIGLIASAIAEGSKVWHEYLVSRDKERSRAAKQAAREYIQVNEGAGEYKDITEKRKAQLLAHFHKRFDHYY